MKVLRDSSAPRSTILIDALAIFVLAAILIYPLFKLKYMNNWGSIESTFISDARMLKENFPNPGWQPNWYCGTRWDYVYPPALRYGTAVLATVLPVIPARAYHIYTGLLFCLGIAGIYLLVRLGSESRWAAWASAFAVATLSPIFLFIDYVRNEASVSMWVPQRLSVLVRYGEGPHISALSMLAFALAFSWIALKSSRPAAMAAAGIFCALVVANNFYGATALAMCFTMLFWAIWVTHQDRAIVLRALGIVGIAYGLSAFWLTPSYLRVTVENLKLVADPGNWWSVALQIVFLLVFGLVSWDVAKKRKDLAWLVFLAGGLSLFSLHVLGNHYFKFLAFGVPLRLMPEFDLFFLLTTVELVRRTNRRVPIVIACLLGVALAVPFLRNAWKIYPWDGGYKGRIEYRITEWIHQNRPLARAFTTGSVRFWYDAWFTGAELGGGSDQGLLNHILVDAQYQIAAHDNRELTVLWLQATGTDLAIVHDKNSKEVYHDYAAPQKFDGLPVVWDSGEGDRIYQIPRRYPGIARVVDRAGISSLRGIRDGDAAERLRSYVDLIEKGPDAPAVYSREGPDVIRVKANVAQGQSVTVLESYDPAWRAYSGSSALPIRRDVMGFMLIETPPGQHNLRIVFETPLQNQLGRAVTFLTLCAVFYLLFVMRKREA